VEEPRKSSRVTPFFHVIANSTSLSNGTPFGANGGLRNWNMQVRLFLKTR